MTTKNTPLQIIADSRFYLLLTRAINQNRVTPATSVEQREGSTCSSWSSASRVSSIDLESSELGAANQSTKG